MSLHCLEIACFNVYSAIHAAKAGAHRIELCADYLLGGITPSLDTLLQIRNHTSPNQPINVMIRPRGGDFTYSDAEFAQMKASISEFKTSGTASGFVFGVLDAAGKSVDVARNRELVALAAPLPCTFHRAFDGLQDMRAAAEALVECGFAAVLTSGGLEGAVKGADAVERLRVEFDGRIVFILGGGVRSANVGGLKERTGVRWFHSAGITGEGEDVDVGEVERLLGELGK
ncbi:hypothetical protein DM02DRAFT_86871 [Periconia macrospinosa]|uniref:Copper homeostasis protein cutC homolog n=1 Tax=Periconia macrospinosa TaxID=97972 RepID=A0A2V1DGQ3_9PLEO|nr:hypothetical protein DM02DRAFT_86871 [Periconia macrospinosa]